MTATPKYNCPCCGQRTLTISGLYDICHLCRWEDDGQGDHNADVVTGGPNWDLSLTQARLNFANYGTSKPEPETEVNTNERAQYKGVLVTDAAYAQLRLEEYGDTIRDRDPDRSLISKETSRPFVWPNEFTETSVNGALQLGKELLERTLIPIWRDDYVYLALAAVARDRVESLIVAAVDLGLNGVSPSVQELDDLCKEFVQRVGEFVTRADIENGLGERIRLLGDNPWTQALPIDSIELPD